MPTDICTYCSQYRSEHGDPDSVACERFTLEYLGDVEEDA